MQDPTPPLDTPEVLRGLKAWLFEGPKYIGSLWAGKNKAPTQILLKGQPGASLCCVCYNPFLRQVGLKHILVATLAFNGNLPTFANADESTSECSGQVYLLGLKPGRSLQTKRANFFERHRANMRAIVGKLAQRAWKYKGNLPP